MVHHTTHSTVNKQAVEMLRTRLKGQMARHLHGKATWIWSVRPLTKWLQYEVKKDHVRTIQNLDLKMTWLYKYNLFMNQGYCRTLACYITVFTKSLDSVTRCHRQGFEFMVHFTGFLQTTVSFSCNNWSTLMPWTWLAINRVDRAVTATPALGLSQDCFISQWSQPQNECQR